MDTTLLLSDVIPSIPMPIIIISLAAITIAIHIFAYLQWGSIFLSALTANLFLGSMAWFGIIPIWIPFLSFTLGLGFGLLPMSNPSSNMPIAAEETDKWQIYGQQLKDAYSAKFGGENKGFNEEIDKRILVMQRLRTGFTHTIARDWLKRMESFTEARKR